jgi:hypothetical protein
VEIERTAKISPAFKFMDVSVSVGESSLVTKYVRLEPKITAYGKRESSPYWRYTPGSGSEVVGGVREMDVIVRRPRGVPVKAAIVAQGNGRQWGIFADPVGVRRQGFEI